MKINSLTPESEILGELAKRLARIRKAQGYTQTRLAEEAGIGVATLRRIESGSDGQLETWIKLLKALGMTSVIDSLLPENFKSPMAEVLSGSSKRRSKTSSLGNSVAESGLVWGDESE